MNYKTLKTCRCCKSENLVEVLDLNTQPLANSYHDGDKELEEYPLKLNVCTGCFHSQLSVVVDPDKMFEHYLYRSGTPKTFNQYCEWFAELAEKENKIGSVLDIACNDGTQLHKFKNKGWKTYGIDPAKNLYEFSSKIADKIVSSYFNQESIKELGQKSFDVIVAQNVFAHTDDVDSFLQDCKTIMNDDTRLYIQTSQADMIEDGQFDTIYHEHLSFFSTRSMKALCDRNGLQIVSVRRVDIHGGSYLFTIMKSDIAKDNTVEESIIREEKAGRYSLEQYKKYSDRVNNIILTSKSIVKEYLAKGYLIIGYGAAAKGNTFLNASGIKPHFIIDDNELKHNKLTPGSNCIIKDKSFIRTLANDVLFIPLSWNFYDEIKLQIQTSLTSNKFMNNFSCDILRYYPTINIEHIKK
jgi:SAM-dependent methyltransferase